MKNEHFMPSQATDEWTVNPFAMSQIMRGHGISSEQLSEMTVECCTRGEGVPAFEIQNFRLGGRIGLEAILMIMNALNLEPSDFFIKM